MAVRPTSRVDFCEATTFLTAAFHVVGGTLQTGLPSSKVTARLENRVFSREKNTGLSPTVLTTEKVARSAPWLANGPAREWRRLLRRHCKGTAVYRSRRSRYVGRKPKCGQSFPQSFSVSNSQFLCFQITCLTKNKTFWRQIKCSWPKIIFGPQINLVAKTFVSSSAKYI